ncbi:MAG: S24 family peptidase [Clostridium perfringens]|nr:S24 family peptidase [Clostridium perfringens]
MNEIGLHSIANKLLEYREKNNLKQFELAKKLEISRSTLSYYENAKSEPPVYILIKMAQVLNCSVDYLLGLSSNNSNNSNINDKDLSTKIFYLNELIKKNNRTFEELSLSKRRTERLLKELNISQKRNSLIYDELRRSVIRNNESKMLLDELTKEFLKPLNENIKEEYAEELVPKIKNTINPEPSYKKKESFLEEYLIDLTENEKLSQKFIPVNVVGSVKCGSPTYAYKEVTSTIALPAKYKDCYLLRAEGDSMNKLFHNGELLVCCPNKLPKHNDIVIAYIPEYEESTCKKLKQKSEIVELHPCSTKAYEIQRYDENSDLQISAVVLGSLSDILEKENIDINELEKELGNYS